MTLVLLSTTACYTWHLEPTAVAIHPKPGKIFQIWIGGEGHRYHDVRMDGDSLIATAFKPTDKYRARPTSFALSEIDSIRASRFSPGKTAIGVVLFAGGTVGLYAAACCKGPYF